LAFLSQVSKKRPPICHWPTCTGSSESTACCYATNNAFFLWLTGDCSSSE